MNLEELQIKIGIELKELNKQLKKASDDINEYLGPKATKKMMADNNKAIKRGLDEIRRTTKYSIKQMRKDTTEEIDDMSKDIHKSLTKAFDIDKAMVKFNKNIDSSMAQAKRSVKSACNDIRRELNAALNVNANIRVSTSAQRQSSSSRGDTASIIASVQHNGAMIVKAINGMIDTNNKNTVRLEGAINKSTDKIVAAITKSASANSHNPSHQKRATKVIIPKEATTTTKGKLVGQPYGPDNRALINALKNTYKAINILNRNLGALNNLKNAKQSGTGSYGSNNPQGGTVNWRQGRKGQTTSLFEGEVVNPITVSIPKEPFKQIQDIITDINYTVKDFEEGLVKVNKRAKSVSDVVKKIKIPQLAATNPLVPVPGKEGVLDTSQIDALKQVQKLKHKINNTPLMIESPVFITEEGIEKALSNFKNTFISMSGEVISTIENKTAGITSSSFDDLIKPLEEYIEKMKFLSGALGEDFVIVDDAIDISETRKQLRGLIDDYKNLINICKSGDSMIDILKRGRSAGGIVDSGSTVKGLLARFSKELDTTLSELGSLDDSYFEKTLSSLKDWVKPLEESLDKIKTISRLLDRGKITNIDTTDAKNQIEALTDAYEALIDACKSNNLNKVKELFGQGPVSSSSDGRQFPAPPPNKKGSGSSNKGGKPPKPTIMGFGLGGFKNEIDNLVELAKKAGSKIKKALSGSTDDLAITIDDDGSADKLVKVMERALERIDAKKKWLADRNKNINFSFDIDVDEYIEELQELREEAEFTKWYMDNLRLNNAFTLDLDKFREKALDLAEEFNKWMDNRDRNINLGFEVDNEQVIESYDYFEKLKGNCIAVRKELEASIQRLREFNDFSFEDRTSVGEQVEGFDLLFTKSSIKTVIEDLEELEKASEDFNLNLDDSSLQRMKKALEEYLALSEKLISTFEAETRLFASGNSIGFVPMKTMDRIQGELDAIESPVDPKDVASAERNRDQSRERNKETVQQVRDIFRRSDFERELKEIEEGIRYIEEAIQSMEDSSSGADIDLGFDDDLDDVAKLTKELEDMSKEIDKLLGKEIDLGFDDGKVESFREQIKKSIPDIKSHLKDSLKDLPDELAMTIDDENSYGFMRKKKKKPSKSNPFENGMNIERTIENGEEKTKVNGKDLKDLTPEELDAYNKAMSNLDKSMSEAVGSFSNDLKNSINDLGDSIKDSIKTSMDAVNDPNLSKILKDKGIKPGDSFEETFTDQFGNKTHLKVNNSFKNTIDGKDVEDLTSEELEDFNSTMTEMEEEFGNLNKALDDFDKKLKEMTESISSSFGNGNQGPNKGDSPINEVQEDTGERDNKSLFDKFNNAVKNTVSKLKSSISKFASNTKNKLSNVFTSIKPIKLYSSIVSGLNKAKSAVSKFASNTKAKLNNAFTGVKFGKLYSGIASGLNKAKAAITKFASNTRTKISSALTGINFGRLYASVTSALNKAKGAVSKFAGKVRPILSKAFKNINLSNIGGTISKGLNKAKGALSKFANGCKTIWGKIKQIFSKGASDASKATGKLTSGLKALLAQALGFFSLYGLINLGKQAITESQTLAQAEVKLTSLMKQRMGATKETVKAIRELAKEQANLGVVSETAMVRGAEQLSMYVHSAKALQTLMPAIANMTARRGGFNATPEDAEEIATQLGEAIREGTTTPLEQSGIYLSEAEIKKFQALRTEEERANFLAAQIAKNVGNINEALANTPHGQIAQLKNNFKSLLGTLGTLLVNVIQPIVKWLNVVVVAANNALKALGELLGFDMSGGGLAGVDLGTGSAGTPVDTSGVDGATDSLDNAKDSAEEAEKAVEKFKGSLMGFDEINILSNNMNDDKDSDSGSEELDPTDITPGDAGQLIPTEMTEGDSIFSKFGEKMKAFMDEIIEPFKNAWALLGDRWKEEWKDLIESFKHFCDSLAKFLKSVWDHGGKEFVQHLAEIGLACGIAAMEIGGEILDSLARLWDHLDPAKNMNTQGFLNALNEVSVKIRDFILGLGDHFESLMANGGQDLLNAFGDMAMNIGEAFVRGIGVAVDAIDGLFDHLDPANNQFTKDMLKAWEGAFDSVGQCALDFVGLLESTLENGGQEIINSLGDLGMKVGEAFGVIVEECAKTLSELFKHMDPETNPHSKKMLESIDGLVDSITEFVDACIKAFQKFMDNGGREFVKNVGDIVAIVIDLAAAFGSGIIDIITGFINSWAGQALIEGVAKALEWVSEKLVGLSDAFEIVKDIFQNIVDIIVGIFEGDSEKVGKAFANLVKNAFKLTGELVLFLGEVAGELIAGLVKGICALPGLLWEAVKFIFDTIVNFFKELFGIHSPSKVFEDFGTNLIEGLVKGVEGAISLVTGAFKKIGETILGAAKEIVKNVSEKFKETKEAINEKLKETKEVVLEKWKEIKETVSEKAKDTYEAAKENWKNIYETVKDKSKETYNTVKDKFKDVYETVKDRTSDTFKNVSDSWTKMKEDAGKKLEQIRTDAEKKYDQVKSSLVKKIGEVKTETVKKWDEVKTGVLEGIEKVRSTAEDKYESIKTTMLNKLEQIKSTTTSKWEEIRKDTADKVESLRTTAEEKYNSLKEKLLTKLEDTKNSMGSKWDAIKSEAVKKCGEISTQANEKFGDIKTKFTSKMEEVKSALGPKWESLKTQASTKASEVAKKAESAFSNIGSKAGDALEKAKKSIDSGLSSIGRLFKNVSWSLPKIKLPHFKISGSFSLNPPSVPKFGVEWYKRGGIIDGITPLGFTGGTMHMGGEAGKEMVVPLENTSFTSKIAQAMGQAVDNAMARNYNNMNNNNSNGFNDNIDVVLQIDGREFARASINQINKLQRESGRTLLDI